MSAPFGLIPQLFISRGRSGGGHSAGEWPRNYRENGYTMMIFFHREISYKEYKKDLYQLDRISNDKLDKSGVVREGRGETGLIPYQS